MIQRGASFLLLWPLRLGVLLLLFAGFSQGFIGVGGGLVMTTLMTVGTDLSQHTVIATALSATTLINTSATVMHYRMGHVCYTRTLYTTLTVLHGNTHA